MKYLFTLLLLVTLSPLFSQNTYTVDIEDEKKNNRLMLYAVNKNLVDLDVSIEVEGTGFRQRKGVPRKYRVPATSKVNILSLVIERGKQPVYTYTLDVSDELSRRVIHADYELIKIDPKVPITLFLPDSCSAKCDSLIGQLDRTPYNYRKVKVSENENVKNQISGSLVGGEERLGKMDTPIVMLGGKMYLLIETYEDLKARLEESDE
ncbi:MAG TPA: hypothetical protein PKW08_11745 [Flavobacteriaceae bacterium]|nr:hypothetical protein [Flavobacteriaceae bacterium]MCB9213198.1 hypothetical protein [Alteromonas sp.]HPF10130.1 hypothetical protein [Flavobacteriaceae bacterium]HQU22251.1 hypothetical protein [Flavobacteriaceae bacterium]HQU66132.1 hypothetical protein [Flavobacteriaceae bacterium]